ncbi:hypothetical protein [Vibrio sp. Sgm 5]|uniref:hypothetical protein n=1 Tax=Vibrio sp. Sgm 5 TaxID=2994387 RepID=UPI0022490DC0|nr:hypothetical protein [Vibrio sp. Sgm 5]MCX2791100.1 hypothetical protein [Vibrio sp. Sgm 5]
MHKVFHHFIATSALLLSSYSHGAFYVNADVKSDSIRWGNVTYGIGDNKVPSKWGVPPALRSVLSWSAGAFSVAPPTSLTLKGGLNVETTDSIPISVTGIQYNTSGTDVTESVNAAGGGCTRDEVAIPLITLESSGTGCISSTTLTPSIATAPFILFRPMFQIDDTAIINALYGKAEGSYSASVPFVISYYYVNTSGISTYRNISDVIIFNFNYDPVEITGLEVRSGDGIMTPNYKSTDRRVTSETNYRLEAMGFFHDGIVLTMPSQDYEMVNSTSPDVTIPYSVVCNECSATKLVDDGVLLEQVTTISEGSGIQKSITFNLKFDYDVDGEALVSGDYADTVTIMVGPGI